MLLHCTVLCQIPASPHTRVAEPLVAENSTGPSQRPPSVRTLSPLERAETCHSDRRDGRSHILHYVHALTSRTGGGIGGRAAEGASGADCKISGLALHLHMPCRPISVKNAVAELHGRARRSRRRLKPVPYSADVDSEHSESFQTPMRPRHRNSGSRPSHDPVIEL